MKKRKTEGKNSATRRSAGVVGIDLATTATKVVRLDRKNGQVFLKGIDLLPHIDLASEPQRMVLPHQLTSHYASLAYTSSNALVRVVNAPLVGEESTLPEDKLRERLNAKEDYRASAQLIKKGEGRRDSSFLAAAVPVDEISRLLRLFSSGSPALSSVEVAGLSFITAFLHACGDEVATDAVCLIDAGETASHFAFLNNGIVLLVGSYKGGSMLLRSRVAGDLEVDDELAGSIISDRSIDVSATVLDVITPFLKQLSMSKDFVERHQSCRISKVYVSGGVSLIAQWVEMVEFYLSVEVVPWNPFNNIECDAILTEDFALQAPLFAAAVGAAIGGLDI